MHQPATIHLYTDGSSRGNPGPGGWGAILMYGSLLKELSHGYRKTTNNRMELMAVIKGLEAIKNNRLPVIVYSDSKYVVDAVEKGWLNNWMRTDFKGGKKNKDLWTHFHQLSKRFNIKFIWVKGHAENPYNNRCDILATEAADSGSLTADAWYEKENP